MITKKLDHVLNALVMLPEIPLASYDLIQHSCDLVVLVQLGIKDKVADISMAT